MQATKYSSSYSTLQICILIPKIKQQQQKKVIIDFYHKIQNEPKLHAKFRLFLGVPLLANGQTLLENYLSLHKMLEYTIPYTLGHYDFTFRSGSFKALQVIRHLLLIIVIYSTFHIGQHLKLLLFCLLIYIYIFFVFILSQPSK